eukprot:gene9635-1839_t
MFGIFGKKEKVKLDNEEIKFEGFLTKKGEKVQNWKKRYFVLTENYISYYPTEKKKSNLGFIKLEDTTTLGSSNEKKSCFTVITPERTYLLSAETDLLMNCWIEKINEVLGLDLNGGSSLNGNSPSPISSSTKSPRVNQNINTSPNPNSNSISRKSLGSATDRNGLNLQENESNSDKSLGVSETQKSPEIRNKSVDLTNTPIKLNSPKNSQTPTGLENDQLSIDDIEIQRKNSRQSSYKMTNNMTTLTPTDEYSIFQSALHIFLKEEDDRKPEEKAYVLSLYEYYEKLRQHIFNTGSKPEFSLASGTYILCKEEELRTEEEQEFLDVMIENYFESLPPEIIPFDIQIDGVLRAKEIFQKQKHLRTKDEKNFVKNLIKFRKDIINIQRKYGLKPENSIISSVISLSKYDEEKNEDDMEFLKEIENLTNN